MNGPEGDVGRGDEAWSGYSRVPEEGRVGWAAEIRARGKKRGLGATEGWRREASGGRS